MFGTLGVFAPLGLELADDLALSETMMDYWIAFAANGDPNTEGLTEWPAYDAATDQHLELGSEVTAKSGLYKEACDLADELRGIR